uniref:Reverse transcriptase domain-containing protein n=1 Tax=Solanum lycopersicum TaxID=4081 RepID=A0A3Q7IEU7_SOLLC
MENHLVPTNPNRGNLGNGAGHQPPLPFEAHKQLHVENQLGDAFSVKPLDHFPIPFMDKMLDRLAFKGCYCFLDGYLATIRSLSLQKIKKRPPSLVLTGLFHSKGCRLDMLCTGYLPGLYNFLRVCHYAAMILTTTQQLIDEDIDRKHDLTFVYLGTTTSTTAAQATKGTPWKHPVSRLLQLKVLGRTKPQGPIQLLPSSYLNRLRKLKLLRVNTSWETPTMGQGPIETILMIGIVVTVSIGLTIDPLDDGLGVIIGVK